MNYKKQKSYEERLNETTEILNKYPNRVPCILERVDNNSTIDLIDKKKFLVPDDLTMSQFIYVIKKRVKLNPSDAIFIFCNKQLLLNQSIIKDIYNKYKEKDNYLYLEYSGESTFG